VIVADVFTNTNKKVEISTPYDPVHLTHVGFNSDTGEFTVRLFSYLLHR
jgi:p21-activated kinase 1